MNYKQAADILDPTTSREALLPYAYDPQYQQMLLRDACQLAAQFLRERDEEIQKISENVTDFGVRYRMVIERLKTLYLRSADVINSMTVAVDNLNAFSIKVVAEDKLKRWKDCLNEADDEKWGKP